MKASQISVSIVLVGTFKPASFTLGSLASGNNLLSSADLQASQYLGLLVGQIVELKICSWGKLTVLPESCTLEVSEAPFVRAADLILRALRELAPESVVKKMGINTRCWYAYENPKDRDVVGMRLAPPENWGAWGKYVAKSIELPVADPKHGGLMAAVMRQGAPDDREAGYIDVRIESAAMTTAKLTIHGIQVLVNDHFESAPDTDGKDSDRVQTVKLLETLERVFDTSIERSIKIAEDVISGGK